MIFCEIIDIIEFLKRGSCDAFCDDVQMIERRRFAFFLDMVQ
jgi:hypothetical protein